MKEMVQVVGATSHNVGSDTGRGGRATVYKARVGQLGKRSQKRPCMGCGFERSSISDGWDTNFGVEIVRKISIEVSFLGNDE